MDAFLSVAFDEDFAAELSENQEAIFEVSMLSKIPDSELAEVNLVFLCRKV